MEDNKRLKRLEKSVEEIHHKLNVIMGDRGIGGYKKIAIKVNPSIKKEINIPKNIQLDPYEKKIAKEIYTAGQAGITAIQISKNVGIEKNSIVALIVGMRQKGIPIKISKENDVVYRFERSVMEVQAKEDFLKLTKR